MIGEDNLELPGKDSEAQLSHAQGWRYPCGDSPPLSQSTWPPSSLSPPRGEQSASPASSITHDDSTSATATNSDIQTTTSTTARSTDSETQTTPTATTTDSETQTTTTATTMDSETQTTTTATTTDSETQTTTTATTTDSETQTTTTAITTDSETHTTSTASTSTATTTSTSSANQFATDDLENITSSEEEMESDITGKWKSMNAKFTFWSDTLYDFSCLFFCIFLICSPK